METLLKPGDIIRIRKDIREDEGYCMILDSSNKNSWINEMAPAEELVTIISITEDGQYTVDYCEDEDFREFWHYTDQMFDPEILLILLEDRYNL